MKGEGEHGNDAEETENRVQFIRQAVADAHADGILFGNSGGTDSALVGILCKMACENTEGIILPCSSKRNFTIDKDDGMEVAEQFGIKTRVIDLTAQKELAIETMSQVATLSQAAIGNLAPRLRMPPSTPSARVKPPGGRGRATPASTTWATLPSGGWGL
ncbi:MAG: hypothetical protein ACLS43_07280 [Evtepia gabavorous]